MNFVRRIERSKWNCLRSGFLALGRASQLKVHLRTKREREQKQTYICFLKVSVPTSLAKIKTYYIPNLFKNRQRWLPFPRWFVSLTQYIIRSHPWLEGCLSPTPLLLNLSCISIVSCQDKSHARRFLSKVQRPRRKSDVQTLKECRGND